MDPKKFDSIPDTLNATETIAYSRVGDQLAGNFQPFTTLGVPTFQLRELIGLGGSGEVWEGVQGSLGRLVALKRLRPDRVEAVADDLFSLEVMLTEFRLEAAITASLEHPGIMPVHELTEDAEGRPMLAMKRMRGRNWQEVLSAESLTMERTEFLARHVGILIRISEAVAFAHSRGIIHRDLKPSQVILGDFGEALLADWGLALVYDLELVPATLRLGPASGILPLSSMASSPAGTPAYMAPEQADCDSCPLGPWTDVFLLGAMLYEILTGTPPNLAANSKLAMFAAAMGNVESPTKRAGDRLRVPPDLEDICLKAMKLKREDRYPSALALIEALEEYLRGAARQRESRVLVEQAAALVTEKNPTYVQFQECINLLNRARSLFPGAEEQESLLRETTDAFAKKALRSGDLMLARLQAQNLDDSERRSKLILSIEQAELAQKRQKLQRRLAQATAVGLSVLLLLGGGEYLRAQKRATEKLQQQMQRTNRARSDAESALTFMIGDLRESLEPAGKVVVLDNLGERAVAYFDSLPESDVTAETREKQAIALGQVGDVREVQGRLEDSSAAYSRAEGLLLVLLEREKELPENRRFQVGVTLAEIQLRHAGVLMTQGRFDEAYPLLKSTIAKIELKSIVPLQRDSITILHAKSLNELGRLEENRGNLEAALALHEEALSLLTALPVNEKNSMSLRRALAFANSTLGRTLQTQGMLPRAGEHFIRAYELSTVLSTDAPSDATLMVELGARARMLGAYYEAIGELNRAAELFQQSSQLLRPLVNREPSFAKWIDDLSVSLIGQARIARTQGRSVETNELFQESMLLRKQLAGLDPSNSTWQRDYSLSLRTFGISLETLGEILAAKEAFELSLQIIDPVVKGSPENLHWQWDRSASLFHLGRMEDYLGNSAVASDYLEQCVALRKDVVSKGTENNIFLRDLTSAERVLAEAYLAEGDTERALKTIGDALTISTEQSARANAALDWKASHAAYLYTKGIILLEEGKPTEAQEILEEGRALMEELQQQNAGNQTMNKTLADLEEALAHADSELGKNVESLELFQNALNHRTVLVEVDSGNALWNHDLAEVNLSLAHELLNRKQAEKAKTHLQNAEKILTEIKAKDSVILDWRVTQLRLEYLMALSNNDSISLEKIKQELLLLPQERLVVKQLLALVNHDH